MQIKPYHTRAAEVACESQICVQVLLSRDNQDVEFISVRPERERYISAEEFTARKLRPVGVIGLHGLQTSVAFKEPLGDHTIAALAQAFFEYVRVLLGGSTSEPSGESEGGGGGFERAAAEAEIAELTRLHALIDPRPYPDTHLDA